MKSPLKSLVFFFFVCRRVFKFSLWKGGTMFFFFIKKKKNEKEVDQRAVGWLSSVGAVYRKAGAALRKRLRYAQNCSLGARVLRRSPFFGELPSYGGFSFGAPTGFQRPQKPILVPPSAAKSSCFRCSTEFSLSSSQKPIGG